MTRILVATLDPSKVQDCRDWLRDRNITAEEKLRYNWITATFGPDQDSDAVMFRLEFDATPMITIIEQDILEWQKELVQYPERKERYDRWIAKLEADIAKLRARETESVEEFEAAIQPSICPRNAG
jgi:hypothetical protein